MEEQEPQVSYVVIHIEKPEYDRLKAIYDKEEWTLEELEEFTTLVNTIFADAEEQENEGDI